MARDTSATACAQRAGRAAAAPPHHRAPAAPGPIRVAILDDHSVVRYGVASRLGREADLLPVGAAENGSQLLALLRGTACNVLLFDYQLAPEEIDGWNLIRLVRMRFAHVRILVYTSHANDATMLLMQRAGAHGFFGKNQDLDLLPGAIRQVAAGQPVFPGRAAAPGAGAPPDAPGAALTPRETEVLRCLLQGMSVSEVAQKFARSIKTVSTQKQSALRKLGVRNNHELFRMDSGWVDSGWLHDARSG